MPVWYWVIMILALLGLVGFLVYRRMQQGKDDD
jgi:hypothetical protein